MSAPDTQANQRNAERLMVGGNVWLHCRRPGTTADLANGLLDLSASGIQLLAKELLRAGDAVEIALNGAGLRGPLRRQGEVRWVVDLGGEACCAGVRFLEPLDADTVQALALPPREPDAELDFA